MPSDPLVFAQLTYRERLRGIEACLRAHCLVKM